MTNQITTLSREELELEVKAIRDSGVDLISPKMAIYLDAMESLLAVMDAKPFATIGDEMLEEMRNGRKTGRIWGLSESGGSEPESLNALYVYTTPPAPSATDGWIKCSDRLPKNGETVLCGCFFDGPHDFRIKTGGLFCGVLCIVGGSWKPTHWMPLPAAPGGE